MPCINAMQMCRSETIFGSLFLNDRSIRVFQPSLDSHLTLIV